MTEKGIVSEILKEKLKEKKKRGRPPSRKREGIKRTSIALPTELYRRLKVYAAIEGRKMNEFMVELLQDALKKRLTRKDFFEEI